MITAGIAGFGWWGRTIASYLADSDVVKLTRVVESDEKVQPDAEKLGYQVGGRFEDLLEDDAISTIIICTPHRFHAEHITAAAKAGKHVFCEKPLCATAAEVDAAIAAVEAAGVRLGIGHERRFEPAVVELRKRAEAGEFGTLLSMEGNFSQDKFLALDPGNWRLSNEHAPVGPLSGTGIHLVDLSISLFGRPKEVWAQLATRGSNFANGDTLNVSLAFENGAAAQIGAILATPFYGRYCVFGSKGWFEIRDRTHPESPTGWDVTVCKRGDPISQKFYEPYDAVRENIETFARSIEGDGDYPVSIDEMRANVHTFDAIIRSARSGKIEKV